jgi:hypothetical protein
MRDERERPGVMPGLLCAPARTQAHEIDPRRHVPFEQVAAIPSNRAMEDSGGSHPDLAILCEIETEALLQAVRRNGERFSG